MSRYPGSYSAYEDRRAQELETLFKAWEAQQEEIARLEDFIRRFRYQASKAAQVQSRVKQLEKIVPIVVPEGMKRVHFRFPARAPFRPDSADPRRRPEGVRPEARGGRTVDDH